MPDQFTCRTVFDSENNTEIYDYVILSGDDSQFTIQMFNRTVVLNTLEVMVAIKFALLKPHQEE
jgi:hypothetical protein